MSPELFMFLLGVFTTMIVGGLTGLAFRKRYWSDLNDQDVALRIEINKLHSKLANQSDRIADVLDDLSFVRRQNTDLDDVVSGLIKRHLAGMELTKSTDSGLQTLCEIVRAIDKDVKRLKKKAKGNLSEIDQKDIDLMKENYVKHYENRAKIDELKKKVETIGGLSVMPCSQVQSSEAEIKGGYTSENDRDYYYYHANNKVKPGSTYKQIEFDNGTDMFTIVLNDGRKIASDITHIKNLLLKEANKLQ